MLDAAGWDRRYADADSAFSTDPNPLLAELASPLSPGRALDLAAGAGRNALWLAGLGWQVTAVDFSRAGLERAAERAAELGLELECVHADLYEYHPPAATFELVLISYMHPDTTQRADVFARAAEAVAPRGRLFVVGFDETDPHLGGGPADPARRFSVDRLSGAFPGIEPERCERVTRERQTPDGPQPAVDAFFWGRRPAQAGPRPGR